MRTVSLLCFGAFALLTLEVAYSLEIRKYEVPRTAFFCGPFTATLKSILNLDAPAAPTPIRSI